MAVLVAGNAGASAVPAVDMVLARDELVRATTRGSLHAPQGNVLGGRRAEAGSESSACASVAGWGGAGGCGSAPPARIIPA
jgi:hypothetical protein